jgi:hypothetical protein
MPLRVTSAMLADELFVFVTCSRRTKLLKPWNVAWDDEVNTDIEIYVLEAYNK